MWTTLVREEFRGHKERCGGHNGAKERAREERGREKPRGCIYFPVAERVATRMRDPAARPLLAQILYRPPLGVKPYFNI